MVRGLLALLLASAPAPLVGASTATQWALQYLKADAVWRITRGSGETVAVVDTGVQPVADVAANVISGADFSDATGKSVSDGRTDIDTNGHGTGEASLIAGISVSNGGTLGLAPDARILPIRAAEVSGPGLVYGVGPAIEYAISRGSRVVNLALTYDIGNSDTYEAVRDAQEHDVVVVAAVGNDGTSRQYYPAAWPGVVGVGAIDSSGKVWERSNTGADVALVAPGVHILRDDNRGRVGYSDGTSEATAYVSAAAALVRSAHPGWSAAEVVAALEETADKPAEMRGAARDDRYGAGVLDVLAAVSLVRPPVVGGVGGKAGRTHVRGSGVDSAWWVVGLCVAGAVGVVGTVAVVARWRGRRGRSGISRGRSGIGS